jgi:acetolactate synthase-1/2/3 large subunit
MLARDEVIVVDTGSLMCPVFQALKVKPPQRIMTAGGLGEMGNALPGAIGASFARGKGEVLAFIGDGGMMMNLQELAVVKHHNLPDQDARLRERRLFHD